MLKYRLAAKMLPCLWQLLVCNAYVLALTTALCVLCRGAAAAVLGVSLRCAAVVVLAGDGFVVTPTCAPSTAAACTIADQ